MIYKDFEDYLQTKHCEANPSVLDDDMPDDYERWLSDLSIEEWVEYGNKYGQIKMTEAYMKETVSHVHDETCPKCGFPETVIVRDARTMTELYMKCSDRKCNWKSMQKSKERTP